MQRRGRSRVLVTVLLAVIATAMVMLGAEPGSARTGISCLPVGIDFVRAWTNDDGVGGDGDDGGPPVAYDAWLAASSADPAEPGPGAGRVDKDVGICTAKVRGSDPSYLDVSVRNAYPGYVCTFNAAVLNGSSLPAAVSPALLTADAGLVLAEASPQLPSTLGPGQEGETAFSLQVLQTAAQGTELHATVVLNLRAGSVPRVPDLRVVKSDGGVSVRPGGVVVYTISYTNVGNETATGVKLFETLPANTTFYAGSSSRGWSCGRCTGGTSCSLTLGTLPPGASGSVTFAVKVNSNVPGGAGRISNTVRIADDGTHGADPTPGNNTSTDDTPLRRGVPDLRVVKSDGGVSVRPGGVVVYTISYTNVGNETATGVKLFETLPANTTFYAGSSSRGWSCGRCTGGTSCSFTLGTLPPGASGSVTFAVKVNSNVPGGAGRISNTVRIADDGTHGADPTPGNNTSTDDTPLRRRRAH